MKHYWFIIILLIGRWFAQGIFAILYNPEADSIVGLSNTGKRAKKIVQRGYLQQQQQEHTTLPPSPHTVSLIEKLNLFCQYGKGNCQRGPGQYAIAALQRLDTIQFIGANVITSIPNNISNRILSINNLAPHWTAPYILGLVIGPSTNTDTPVTGAKITRENSAILGEYAIVYHCDSKKISSIQQLSYTEFLDKVKSKDPMYWAPCSDYRMPHMLAFNYFHYLKNSEKAALYYMVAALHDEVPSITIAMPAIIRSQHGDNLTSASLWYDRLQNTIQEYQQLSLSDQSSEKGKSLTRVIDMSTKKSAGELSLYILNKTYPHGLSEHQDIRPQDIKRTLHTITSNCDNNSIACTILELAMYQGWINPNGFLIYPIENSVYTRFNDTTRRGIQKPLQ